PIVLRRGFPAGSYQGLKFQKIRHGERNNQHVLFNPHDKATSYMWVCLIATQLPTSWSFLTFWELDKFVRRRKFDTYRYFIHEEPLVYNEISTLHIFVRRPPDCIHVRKTQSVSEQKRF